MALFDAKDKARSSFSVLKVEIRIYDDDTSLSRVLQVTRRCSGLDSVLAELGVIVLLLGSDSLVVLLGLGEGSSGGTGSSHSKVVGGVSRLGEGVSGSGTSLLGKDGEDLGDVLAYGSDSSHLGLRGRGDLGDSEGGKFFLYRWKKHRLSIYSKENFGSTYSLEVEFLSAFWLRFSSKFMGSNTVHIVDNN